jgi:hypothetical protein
MPRSAYGLAWELREFASSADRARLGQTGDSKGKMHTRVTLGVAALALIAIVLCLLWRNRSVHRRELPRIYELRDLLPEPLPPEAYFQNLDKSLAEIPQKLRQFREIEKDLQGLDTAAWSFPASGSSSREGTTPPTFAGKSPTTLSGSRRMPERPAKRRDLDASTPAASGVTTPRPVTTIRRIIFLSSCQNRSAPLGAGAAQARSRRPLARLSEAAATALGLNFDGKLFGLTDAHRANLA